MSKGLTAAKAKKILEDGTIRGKALTEKQKKFFGAIASGATPLKKLNGGWLDKYQNGGDVSFDSVQRAVRNVESLDGKLMWNPESTATGLYGQRFSEIKNEYPGTRREFAQDTVAQNEFFKNRFYEGLPATKTTSLAKDASDLYEEYAPQIPGFDYSKEDIAVLSNFLGRQGTRNYLGYHVRDKKPLEEALPNIYGSDAKQRNKTPQQYLKQARQYYKEGGWLDKFDNGGVQPNYNDSNVSLPPGFKGWGYDNSPSGYNPAWNGPVAQTGYTVPLRKGVRKNPDGSESTHLMATETLDGKNWFSFPTLFQDPDGTWIDMSDRPWEEAYEEAKRRGEVVDFGTDKERAIKFGEGSWKTPKKQMGGTIPGATGMMYARTSGTSPEEPKKAQDGTVMYGTPEYEAAYREGRFADVPNVLDEVVITSGVDYEKYPRYDKLSAQQKEYFNDDGPIGRGVRRAAQTDRGLAEDASSIPGQFGMGALESMQTPQSLMVEGVEALRGNDYNFSNALPGSGMQRIPSQLYGFQDTDNLSWYHPKNISNFVLDAATDPLDLVGAGYVGNLNKLGKAVLKNTAKKLHITNEKALEEFLKDPKHINNPFGFRRIGDTEPLKDLSKLTPENIDLTKGFEEYAESRNAVMRQFDLDWDDKSTSNEFKNYYEELLKVEKELQQDITPFGKHLGSGLEGSVYEFANHPDYAIKSITSPGRGQISENPSVITSFRDKATAIPLRTYMGKDAKVSIMDNLKNTKLDEPLNLSERDAYANLLKRIRRLRDAGIELDLDNRNNIHFNQNKGVYDIYDLNYGKNGPYYMTYVNDKLRSNKTIPDKKENGGWVDKYEGEVEKAQDGGAMVSQYEEPAWYEKVLDYAASPMTTLGYLARGEDLPDRLPINVPGRSEYDNWNFDAYNPAAYIKYGASARRKFEEGEYLDSAFDALSAIPILPSFLKKGKKPVKAATKAVTKKGKDVETEPLRDLFIQPNIYPTSSPLPKNMEPYLSRKVYPFNKEQEIFESFLPTEAQLKNIDLKSIRYDADGNIIPNMEYGGEIDKAQWGALLKLAKKYGSKAVDYLKGLRSEGKIVVQPKLKYAQDLGLGEREKSLANQIQQIGPKVKRIADAKEEIVENVKRGESWKYPDLENTLKDLDDQKSLLNSVVTGMPYDDNVWTNMTRYDLSNAVRSSLDRPLGTIGNSYRTGYGGVGLNYDFSYPSYNSLGRESVEESVGKYNKYKTKEDALEALDKKARGNLGMFYNAMFEEPSRIDYGNLLKYQNRNGGVIEDDRGQWAYPGEITKINSNNITMKGVNYPVLGISDTGDTKMMQPGKDYKFKGNSVTEFPMAQNGADLTGAPQKEFLERYMNSPRYNEMVNASVGNEEAAAALTNQRRENLRSVTTSVEPYSVLGQYNTRGHNVIIDSDVATERRPIGSEFKDVMLHELSHSQDFTGRKLNMPSTDVDMIKSFSKPATKGLGKSDAKYIAQPSETRSRLNALRYFYEDSDFVGRKDQGLPSIMDTKVTPEMLNQMKASTQYHDLKEVYSDDQILEMLNTISDTSKSSASNVAYAQDGKNIQQLDEVVLKGARSTPEWKAYQDSLDVYNKSEKLIDEHAFNLARVYNDPSVEDVRFKEDYDFYKKALRGEDADLGITGGILVTPYPNFVEHQLKSYRDHLDNYQNQLSEGRKREIETQIEAIEKYKNMANNTYIQPAYVSYHPELIVSPRYKKPTKPKEAPLKTLVQPEGYKFYNPTAEPIPPLTEFAVKEVPYNLSMQRFPGEEQDGFRYGKDEKGNLVKIQTREDYRSKNRRPNGKEYKNGGTLAELDQLTNFTNYNTPQPGGWLDKYN